MDGLPPECDRCPIPPLTETGARVMEIRGLLASLHDVVDPATIIRICGGMDKQELELLAAVEMEIKATSSKD